MIRQFNSHPAGSSTRVDFTGWSILSVALVTTFFLTGLSTIGEAAPPLDFESKPINYSHSAPNNAISRLQAAINSGERILPYEDQFGYLRGVLKELDVPQSSQMLTFLKSSLQRPLIAPKNARALYFGDDAYVGYVPDGMLEIIVPDEKLGMVFYTLEQNSEKPRFERQVSRCMTCHSSSRTKNIPGLQVRSMMTDPGGEPVLSAGSYRTDHSSPFEKRWGGWFVSGTHGDAHHLGNFQLPDKKRPQQPIDNVTGVNVIDLSQLTDLSKQLTPHSDLVALMVFEHQIDAHNLMVRTNYAWQIDVYQERENGEDARWKQEADALIDQLLFTTQLHFNQPIQGTSSFADEFSQRELFQGKGSQLRQLDLKTRVFRSPVSYTIGSTFFRALSVPVRSHIVKQIDKRLRAAIDPDDDAGADQRVLLQDLPDLLLEDQTGVKRGG
ncbi:hypothetical protein [Gimesia algae]|uniref:Cytochrome c domain-containing protein n=1 Tax=Gimesia algae TaxID=2527971 RepID=A0A517VA80_9PLAN|nr:hypothetical protein [Gimesia algae]QDT89912.1 hypothetical protein Pan161_15450 [Gimesia algae]